MYLTVKICQKIAKGADMITNAYPDLTGNICIKHKCIHKGKVGGVSSVEFKGIKLYIY